MKPRLLQRDGDVAFDDRLPAARQALVQDLELETLVEAMAQGDSVIRGVAHRVLLDPVGDLATIAFRQQVLRDCLAHPEVPRALYGIAVRTLERRKKVYWGLARRPESVVQHGIELLWLYLGAFRGLRRVADAHHQRVGGEAFGGLLAAIRRELDDAYLSEIDAHVRALRFRAGVRLSARLSTAGGGTAYLLEPPSARQEAVGAALAGLWRALRRDGPHAYTFRLPKSDDSGVRALAELSGRGLERAAEAIKAACDGILWYFRQLRGELAFYVGGLNLHQRLTTLGGPVSFPEPLPVGSRVLSADGLYDASLALTLGDRVVPNDVDADGAELVVITGANQGGKTTFLRSLGVAQLLMQSGMPVPARAFRSSVTTGVFSHFERQEDVRMQGGKLDEELARLSGVVDELAPGATLLLNESFASTNEREGSDLAGQVVRALTESGVRVLFVTHLSQFARGLYDRRTAGVRLLQAERLPDGTRTFRMLEGAPATTSHGEDLYRQVFAVPVRERS